jgi:hypothetical protein
MGQNGLAGFRRQACYNLTILLEVMNVSPTASAEALKVAGGWKCLSIAFAISLPVHKVVFDYHPT